MKNVKTREEIKYYEEKYRKICLIILLILGLICFFIAIHQIHQGNIVSATILFGIQIIIFILVLRYRYIRIRIGKMEVEAKA
ncbi:MAG: hypothetical protein RMI79_04400 [Nitrososphaerota archaeon]|nr:hypothetical protein [Nitrososphaerota archaeon]